MSDMPSDGSFRKAAAKLREVRFAAQQLPEDYEHEFSPQFEQAMDELIQKSRRKAIWRRVVTIVASILLVLLISVGAVLTFNQEARASFVSWLREQYENSIIYRFWGGGDSSEFPTYQIGWLPEGFELLQEIEEENLYIATYLSSDGEDTIVFIYAPGGQRNEMEVWGDIDNSELVSINGLYGEYVPAENRRAGDLIWIDESTHIVFTVSATLEKETIVRIAKSVYLVK